MSALRRIIHIALVALVVGTKRYRELKDHVVTLVLERLHFAARELLRHRDVAHDGGDTGLGCGKRAR